MTLSVATTASGQLAYIAETTAGQTPTTGKGTNLRMTGESFEQTVSKEVSKEINSTRQTAGMFLTDSQVSGGFQFEVSAGEYDPLLEALLMDTWSEFGTNGKSTPGSITFSATDNSATLPAGVNGLAKLTDGCYVTFSGEGIEKENRGPLRVKSVAGQKVTFHDTLKTQTVRNCVAHHSRLTNGVTKRSFTFEKMLSDLNQSFAYRGCRISKASWSFESKAAVTGSFEVLGMGSTNAEGRQLGDKTEYTESKANPIIDAVLGMDNVLFDGKDARVEMTAGVQKISLDFDNNMKAHDAIGVLGAVDVTAGVINCSGNLSMYFASGKIYNDVITQRRFNLSFKVFDREGHGYAFTLPSVELNSPKVNIGDNDSPVMVELEFTALMHPTLKKTIFIDRF